jgi:hypothetical protein
MAGQLQLSEVYRSQLAHLVDGQLNSLVGQLAWNKSDRSQLASLALPIMTLCTKEKGHHKRLRIEAERTKLH